ncbi:hypothetical protein ANCCAN_26575 [Ancylostoma caninum]|uniref:DUF5641 domain-containing protein n=1 Tax=Ancylostoma caninum TaxID=29170 RepID=A0A368FBY6_ANCCA|nr:hypothetical protein ANCCAN_26575 [Ancylostoma caninum]
MTLAMRLSNSVFSELKETITVTGIYLFSDSEIVLSRPNLTPEQEVRPFAHNRLVEIRNIAYHIMNQQCEVMIGYVSSLENPADCGTRGLIKEEAKTYLWWSGPEFMQSSPTCWPNQSTIFTYLLGDQEEMTRQQANSPEQVLTVELRFHEIRQAGKVLICHHQTTFFTPHTLRSLQQLNIRQDEQGLPPFEGTLVLISDPILPRHSWKIGTIDQVIANARGTILEAVVRLTS